MKILNLQIISTIEELEMLDQWIWTEEVNTKECTCRWLRDNRLMVEGMVILVEIFGVEGTVHPVVERFCNTSMEYDHPQETFPIPAGHVAETREPCMSQCHQQKLQHNVVVSAYTTHQTTNCISKVNIHLISLPLFPAV